MECCCQEGEGNVPEPRGFCIDEMRMGKICIAGSALEEKMPGALKECSDQCEMLPESRTSSGKNAQLNVNNKEFRLNFSSVCCHHEKRKGWKRRKRRKRRKGL